MLKKFLSMLLAGTLALSPIAGSWIYNSVAVHADDEGSGESTPSSTPTTDSGSSTESGGGGGDTTLSSETPTSETPSPETPASETPSSETPASETPSSETPASTDPAPSVAEASAPVSVEEALAQASTAGLVVDPAATGAKNNATPLAQTTENLTSNSSTITDNVKDIGIATNDTEGVIDTNNGTVYVNEGEIKKNSGDVVVNDKNAAVGENAKDIDTNAGKVTDNGTLNEDGSVKENGKIKTNTGKLINNNGEVGTNTDTGEITNNNEHGSVDINDGKVENNIGLVKDNNKDVTNSSGEVTVNDGTVTNNTGKVGENNELVENNKDGGTIDENNGTVATNEEGAIIDTNTAEAVVKLNNGTVSTNNGTVEKNDKNGKVNDNSGTVVLNDGTVVNTEEGKVEVNFGGKVEGGKVEINLGGEGDVKDTTVEKQMWKVASDLWDKLTGKEKKKGDTYNYNDVDLYLWEDGALVIKPADNTKIITAIDLDEASKDGAKVEKLSNGSWRISGITKDIKITPEFADKPAPKPTPKPSPSPDPKGGSDEPEDRNDDDDNGGNLRPADMSHDYYTPVAGASTLTAGNAMAVVSGTDGSVGAVTLVPILDPSITASQINFVCGNLSSKMDVSKAQLVTTSSVRLATPGMISMSFTNIMLTANSIVYVSCTDLATGQQSFVQATVNANGTISFRCPYTYCAFSVVKF